MLLFAPASRAWQKVQKIIGQDETKKLKLVFKVFESKFKTIWEKRYSDFISLKAAIQNQKSAIKQALQIINSLCNISSTKLLSPIIIRLLFSQSKNDLQVWAYRNIIAIEGLSYPLKKIDNLTNGILLHEYFHLALNQNVRIKNKVIFLSRKHKNLLLKLKIPGWSPQVILEEALVSSFIPEGYLNEKLSRKDLKREALKQISRKKN